MDAEKWQQVKSVLEKALDVPRTDRSIFLEQQCNGDTELRREVASLLAAEQDAERFEVSAAAAALGSSETNGDYSYDGRVIGKYRIVRPIGAGGMGAVFLAERSDGEFSQTVAIKLIKTGFASDAVLQRFLNERQILARLEHPNIARLIDGGSTDDGAPYLVMEYVEGLPINEYADAQKLGFEERLDLFQSVCAAVTFAHRNLVIHRDLKPTNILVTTDGKPKLLDFGIAKLVSPEGTGEAATRHFALTPEYASPEQILGENLTTATDVYSLGVILFELLTGQRPFARDGSVGEIVRSSTTAPARPSAVTRGATGDGAMAGRHARLRGDLDNIILKALKFEPDRRYASVDQFVEDIRRHLRGLPVLARADTLRYRAQKFASRNPLVVGSAALALVILLGGIAATGYQARRAEKERARAEQRFNEVRALANSFIFEVNEKIDESPIKARELVVTRALEYLDRLAAESGGDAGLQAELAAAYEKIGEVQAELFNPSLGDAGEALESHKKALQLRQALYDADKGNVTRVMDLSRSYQQIGSMLMVTGDIRSAADRYRAAIALSSGLMARDPGNIEVRKQLRSLHLSLGQSILRSGSLSECVDNYVRAYEINETLLSDDPDDNDPVRAKFIILNYLGYARLLLGDREAAVNDFQESLELALRFAEGSRDDLRAERSVVSGYLFLGIGLREAGHIDEALINLREALERQRRIFQLDQENLGERNGLADCYLELGAAETKGNRTAAAIKSLRSAMEHYSIVAEHDPNDLAVRRQMVLVRLRMAAASSGDRDDALSQLQAARAEAAELVRRDPNNLEWKHDLALANLWAAEILKEKGAKGYDEQLATAVMLLEELTAVSPENSEFATDLDKARSL